MKWIRYFILAAGAILLVAALNRFFIAFSNAQVLSLPEPVLGIPLRYTVLLVGLVELAVAWLCLFGKRVGLQAGCVAWLGLNYLVYRIGAQSMDAHHQATAIGGLTDPLHLMRGFAGMLAGFAPVCFLVGGSASTAWLWLGDRLLKRRKEDEKSIKMSCPECGTHIRFDSSNLGQNIPCPQCKAAVTLRRPNDTLRMPCFFCGENLEFLPHAIGKRLKCPHCSKEITLKDPVAR